MPTPPEQPGPPATSHRPVRDPTTRTGTYPPRLSERDTRRQLTAEPDAAGPPGREAANITRSGKLRVGTINAQSLAPKVDEVINLLRTERLDVLCVSETWLHSNILTKFLSFPGYHMVRRDRPKSMSTRKTRGGGVAVILKQDINYQQIKIAGSDLLETLWLTITWPGGRPSVIGVVYRPPSGSALIAIEDLQCQLQEVLTAHKLLFLLGT